MSNRYEQIKRDLISAVNASKPKTSGYDTTAEVLYEDGDTLWVKIPGGVGETPVEKSIAAKRGDIVQIRVANGRAWINGNNTAPPTDDTTAIYAREVAVETNQNLEELEEYFWHDEQGAHVLGNKSGYRNDIKSDGMHIVQTSTGDEVAKFTADGSQIGKDDEGHVTIDYHSMKLYNRRGTAVFEIIDERDVDGYVQLAESFEGDGSTKNFSAKYPLSIILSVSVNGVVIPANEYTVQPQNPVVLRMQNAPADGTVLRVEYKTIAAIISFTFGSRADSSERGMISFAEGVDIEASGTYAHGEGYSTKASGKHSHAEGSHAEAMGDYSHAENYYTKAGTYAHAEGQYTEASGSSSHAQNTHTIAAGSAQTAMGRYNEPDSSTYGLILGNGTSTSRHNALAVTWNGDVEFDINYGAASGSIDGNLVDALTSQGWGDAALVGSAVVGTTRLGTSISSTNGSNSLKKLLTNIINAL